MQRCLAGQFLSLEHLVRWIQTRCMQRPSLGQSLSERHRVNWRSVVVMEVETDVTTEVVVVKVEVDTDVTTKVVVVFYLCSVSRN